MIWNFWICVKTKSKSKSFGNASRLNCVRFVEQRIKALAFSSHVKYLNWIKVYFGDTHLQRTHGHRTTIGLLQLHTKICQLIGSSYYYSWRYIHHTACNYLTIITTVTFHKPVFHQLSLSPHNFNGPKNLEWHPSSTSDMLNFKERYFLAREIIFDIFFFVWTSNQYNGKDLHL